MKVYAFGTEEHTYTNTGSHTSDLYYYSLGGRLLGTLDNTGTTSFDLTDALGSVLGSFSNVADSAAIKGNQVFGPYGNARAAKGTIMVDPSSRQRKPARRIIMGAFQITTQAWELTLNGDAIAALSTG